MTLRLGAATPGCRDTAQVQGHQALEGITRLHAAATAVTGDLREMNGIAPLCYWHNRCSDSVSFPCDSQTSLPSPQP